MKIRRGWPSPVMKFRKRFYKNPKDLFLDLCYPIRNRKRLKEASQLILMSMMDSPLKSIDPGLTEKDKYISESMMRYWTQLPAPVILTGVGCRIGQPILL